MNDKAFALIATGDELCNGTKINTNTAAIAGYLHSNYIKTAMHITCADNFDQLTQIIKYLLPEYNVIITGGLGPTDDDLTRDVVAHIVEKKLIFSNKVSLALDQYLTNKGIKISNRHKRQCYFPEGSMLIENNFGTAWGFASELNANLIFALPGPPKENQPMFQNCLDKIKQTYKIEPEHRLHWLLISPEEKIVNSVDDLVKKYKLELHTCVHSNKTCDLYISLAKCHWDLSKVKFLSEQLEQEWSACGISFEAAHILIGE